MLSLITITTTCAIKHGKSTARDALGWFTEKEELKQGHNCGDTVAFDEIKKTFVIKNKIIPQYILLIHLIIIIITILKLAIWKQQKQINY